LNLSADGKANGIHFHIRRRHELCSYRVVSFFFFYIDMINSSTTTALSTSEKDSLNYFY
jgi:hypothetical protein